MSNFKYKNLALIFILLLSCIFLIQSWIILERIKKTGKIAVFMPLLIRGENYRSYDLEKPGAQANRVLENVGRVGPAIALEDMVRGILLLEKKEGLSLSPSQKSKISAILKNAYKKREELLRCQSEILTLQHEVPDLGARIYDFLTPKQKEYIISKRDEVSLKEFEEPAWENLIESLEKAVE